MREKPTTAGLKFTLGTAVLFTILFFHNRKKKKPHLKKKEIFPHYKMNTL